MALENSVQTPSRPASPAEARSADARVARPEAFEAGRPSRPAPLLHCPDGCGQMAAHSAWHRAHSSYDAPSGPVWSLTCPSCGWEVHVDRAGLPFWARPLKTCCVRLDVEGRTEADVHPKSRLEVERRVHLMAQLRGNRAVMRN